MTEGISKFPIRLVPVCVGNIPEEMRGRRNWVCWKVVVRRGRPTKVPYRPDGRCADSTDPGTWYTFEEVLAAYEAGGFDGIGFVFSADAPYCGVDIDGGRNADTGGLFPWAQEIVEGLGSYSEVSPSGTGIKVVVEARKPGPKCKKAYADGHVEIYDRERFFTVTGAALEGAPKTVEARQDAIEDLYEKVFGAKKPTLNIPVPTPPKDAADNGDVLSDERIIDIASDRRRRNGAGDKFAALWAGQWRELFGSQSEADASLVFRLAYYTKDPVQLDRLFRQSALMRDKWDERHGSETYGERIIRQALETVTAQYRTRKVVSAAEATRYVSASPVLPEVLLPGGVVSITEASRKLGPLLAATKRYYVRGGAVVALDQDDENLPILQVVKPAAMTSILEGVAALKKYAKVGANFVEVETTCSEQTAKLLMHADAFLSELPPIRILTRCAVLIERNGQLLQVSGYDRESGILAAGSPALDVPLNTAVEMLCELLADFKFATPSDLSRALASLVTPALVYGGLLKGRAPIDLGEADASQSGKGFRVKLVAAVYRAPLGLVTQRKGGVGSTGESLDAELIRGRSFISLDNIRGDVDLPALESLMTEDRYLARVPYQPPVEIDPRRIVIAMTSNKAETTVDLANRCSCTRILKQARGYRFRSYPEGDILDRVRANQPHYLGAVFAIIKAWHAAGKPRTADCDHDFRPWARTLGWIIDNVFRAAPLLDGHREAQVRIANPNLNWLRSLAIAVRQVGALDQWLRANQLIDILSEADAEMPGLVEGGDVSDEGARKSVLQAVGRRMSLCFAGQVELRIDDMVIRRREEQDSIGRPVREYRFEVDVSGSRCSPGPISETSARTSARTGSGQEDAPAPEASFADVSLMGVASDPLIKSPNPLIPADFPDVLLNGQRDGKKALTPRDIGMLAPISEISEMSKTYVKSVDEDWEEI